MPSTSQNNVRTSEIPSLFGTEEDVASIQQHLREVVEGSAFKGSHRSGQFLKYIVEQAMTGHFDSLKERVIGVELFGRSPSYDTGDDAIVRVTASDVRKRLLQHYGASGSVSEFRICLPSGCYIPKITRGARCGEKVAAADSDVTFRPASAPVSPASPAPMTSPARVAGNKGIKWPLFAIVLLALNIAMWGIFGRHSSPAAAAAAPVSPWSELFNAQHATFLVTSDPDIDQIQGLTGATLSISDYANQKYLPSSGVLTPEVVRISRDILRGDKAANVDTTIVASLAELAQENSSKIGVRHSRDLRFSDLDTENNFIFLGSPRSDPWTGLFTDQLDFRYIFDKTTQQDIIHNIHPHPGEAATYISSARGYGTGESFATISYVGNPNHAGQVLLLGGANAEGTKAAGELVSNTQALSIALRRCGIQSSNPVQHFQLLLRVNIMAGSPRDFDVLACHLLR